MLASIEAILPLALAADRWAARQALSGSARVAHPQRLSGWLERLQRSAARRQRRLTHPPALGFDESLPIMAQRQAIEQAIKDHRVLIVAGETGSGKSTQLPKLCLAAGRGSDGLVGCTQPRRIAAVAVAARIAEELGQPLGRHVGHRVRFQDRTGPDTRIKVMTDGILLAEAQRDPLLLHYDTLIVDEAHERSLNIDFILGLLRRLLRERDDLKVLVTSATIDTEKFARAFDDAPVIEVSGRLYPVSVRYHCLESLGLESANLESEPHIAMTLRALELLLQAHSPGDVLIFMPTEADIRETCELIAAHGWMNVAILPLFARMGPGEQQRIFARLSERKVIVATNIAETSLTIPGIRYVIDSGLARVPHYSPRSRTTRLPVVPISRSSADQRAGRCGRVADGLCVRLYSEQDYAARARFTLPEIQRANLAEVILRMLALGLGDASAFPFIDAPAPASIRDGLDLLEELGAIERLSASGTAPGGTLRLTERGALMARLPLDPRLARILIEARREGCLEPALVIAAALSVRDPRLRPLDKAAAADAAQRCFIDPRSDFITLLNIWRRSQQGLAGEGRSARLRRLCREHLLSFRAMREWQDVHGQLTAVIEECEDRWLKAPAHIPAEGAPLLESAAGYATLHRAVLSGFLANIARRGEPKRYQAARGREVVLFPGSALAAHPPEWIVAAEMVETSRLYARTVAAIDCAWLEALGGQLLKRRVSDPHWERKRGEVQAFEQLSLYGLIVVARRPVSYARFDPEAAAELFVRHALVEEDLETPPAFLRHNRRLLERLASVEERLRRRGLLIDAHGLEAFYRERLGLVSDLRALRRRIREAGGDGFLRLRARDVWRQAPDEQELSLYPEWLSVGGRQLSLSYAFTPGGERDGLTVRVPLAEAAGIDARLFSWTVPGLLREKVAALLRALPKELRRRLMPLNATAQTIFREMPRQPDSTLAEALSVFIAKRFGLRIAPATWDETGLPEHLRARIALVDEQGREIQAGRDPALLRRSQVPPPDDEALTAQQRQFEREGLTRWEVGTLPAQLVLSDAQGRSRLFFPALVPETREGARTVSLRLLSEREAASSRHRQGVARLLALGFPREVKFLRQQLALSGPARAWAVPFGGPAALLEALIETTLERQADAQVRSAEQFTQLAARAVNGWLRAARELQGQVLAVLEAHAAALASLTRLLRNVGAKTPLADFLQQRQADLERLAPADLLRAVPAAQLTHLPRYLRALQLRLERAFADFERDRARGQELTALRTRYERLRAGLTDAASAEKHEALEEVRWLLEELAVSLFAQELRTAQPVSVKRIGQKLAAIEQMA